MIGGDDYDAGMADARARRSKRDGQSSDYNRGYDDVMQWERPLDDVMRDKLNGPPLLGFHGMFIGDTETHPVKIVHRERHGSYLQGTDILGAGMVMAKPAPAPVAKVVVPVKVAPVAVAPAPVAAKPAVVNQQVPAGVKPAVVNQQVAHALATIPDVCGIMVVNVLGTPADLPALRKLADEYKIWFLEDNCESLGAAVGGAYAGTWGDLSTFSFFWSHHITTGEGGMVLARNPYLYGLARSMRSHGWTRGVANMVGGTPDPRYAPFDFVVPGYNFRMMDTQAAPGRVQLRKLDEQVTFRFNNLKALRNNIKGTSLEPAGLRGAVSPMAAPSLYTGSNFEKFNRRLQEAGIESRPLIAGNILRQRVAKQYNMSSDSTNLADRWHDRGFYLGIYGEPMEQYVFDELRKIACE
jgi:dTDP-4-amino-4,6-dideoxygalactose transaminase